MAAPDYLVFMDYNRAYRHLTSILSLLSERQGIGHIRSEFCAGHDVPINPRIGKIPERR